MANVNTQQHLKILQDIAHEKDFIVQSVAAIYLESKKIAEELKCNEEISSVRLKKKLVQHHGQLIAIKDMLVLNDAGAQNLAAFPVQLNTSEKLDRQCLAEFINPKPADEVVASTPGGRNIRGMILEQNEPQGSKLVDSGENFVEKCEVYQMDADIENIPQQAVLCSSVQDSLLYKISSEAEETLGVTFVKTLSKSSNEYAQKHSVLISREANAQISKIENAIVSTTSCRDLTQGVTLDVVVAHVESPYQIYVSTIDKEASLAMDRMHEEMKSIYVGLKQTACVARVGDMVAVNVEDDLWFRGKVLRWEKHENGVTEERMTVFLLDFGNTIEVLKRQCADIPLPFQSHPAYVQCVSLAKIYPAPPHKEWPVKVSAKMRNILKGKIVSVCVITCAAEDGAIPSVAMNIKLGKQEINLNALLVKKNMATFLPIEHRPDNESLARTEQEELDAWDPMAEDHRLGHMDDGNVSQAVVGYNPKDEQRVCYLFQKTGKCNRLRCKKEHIQLHPDGWTTDQEEIPIAAFNSLELPVTGSRLNFKVTEILDLNHMFGNLEPGLKVLDGTLQQLMEYMNEPKERTATFTTVPAVRQIVLCKETTQDLLYRARVVDISDHVNVQEVFIQVYFVDYGSTVWVELQNLREIPPKFLHLPFQAVELRLADFVGKPCRAVEGKQKLMRLVEDAHVSADVVSTAPGQHQSWTIVVENAQLHTTPLREMLQDYVEDPQVTEIYVAENSTIIPG